MSAAQGLYTAGEATFARGRYADALNLWRHALLQLPQTPDYDDLRHQLILRMAYAFGMGYESTRERAYLTDAKAMLERYLALHGRIAGDDDRGRRQRGQVYEILHEVESRLMEEVPPSMAGGAEPTHAAASPGASADPHAGEVLRDRGERIVVARRPRPSVDDPRVRARLRSRFTEPGPFLVLPTWAQYTPPRGLVRVRRLPSHADPSAGRSERLAARSRGFDLLRASRPALRRCYEAAFARSPTDVVRNTIEITIAADGQVSRPRIVEGRLVDPIGDACLLDTLDGTRIAALDRPDDAREIRVRLPLLFFWQDRVMVRPTRDGAEFRSGADLGRVQPEAAIMPESLGEMRWLPPR